MPRRKSPTKKSTSRKKSPARKADAKASAPPGGDSPGVDLGELHVEMVAVDRLDPAPYNPRVDLKPGDPDYEKIRRSLDTFGLVEPLVWNKRSGHLVGGHQRLKVLTDRGDTAVPVAVVDLDDVDERTLNVALNKTGGDWDHPKLGQLLKDLSDAAADVSLTGFDEAEIEREIAQIDQAMAEGSGEGSGGGDKELTSSYQVMAECDGEADQKRVYDLLKANGVKCRLLTLY